MSTFGKISLALIVLVTLVACAPSTPIAPTPVPPQQQPTNPPFPQEIQITQPEKRSIAVVGEGEVKVVPDFVEFVVGIETESGTLAPAKKANDAITLKVMEVIKKYGIDEKDFKTSYLSIYPQTDYRSSAITGYTVYNSIKLTVRDLNTFEALLTDVLGAGANRISGISFQVTDMDMYKAQARELALKNAKDKATDMASVLDQEIGAPLTIQEVILGSSGRYLNLLTDAVILSDAYIDTLSTIAIGQISIKASVTVEFELK